jgi:Fic family protein
VASDAGVEVPIVWRGRRVMAFVPALIVERDLQLSEATARRTGAAAADVGNAADLLTGDYEALARLLLRAEGLASSFVEGVRAPVVDVVLAEEGGGADAAAWVASNLAATRQAIDSARTRPFSVSEMCDWHRRLMVGSPTPEQYVGRVRTEQGWIGGTSPLDAHLVTPPPDRLEALLDDLVVYVNREDLDPIAQAAIAHAQFEVIHPFGDGNGRIGRVLVAWLLTRHLSVVTPPPVSVRVAADVGGYAAGLTLYRLGQHEPWVQWFAECVSSASGTQRDLVANVRALMTRWARQLGVRRGERSLRSDATAWRVLHLLPRMVVLNAEAVARELDVSNKTANTALWELVEAAILVEYSSAVTGRGRPAKRFVSGELLGLVGATPFR